MIQDFQPVRYFEQNTTGRDFFVGDIHGCFSILRELMEKAAFDKTKDRLFSVGDLVDRGPESEEAIDWIREPWFHAVRGNHEQICIDVVDGHAEKALHVINGGSWFYDLQGHYTRKDFAAAFKTLPFAFEIAVDGSDRKLGIVHAETFGDLTWQEFIKKLEDGSERAQLSAMWGRERIRSKNKRDVEGIAGLMVGHTPVGEFTSLGNVLYIDTGACFNKGFMALACFNTGIVYTNK